MVTVSRIVEDIVKRRPFLEEALAKGIINYAALADDLTPEVKGWLKKEVKPAAVMMALRRLSERIGGGFMGRERARFTESDLTVKSGLIEITFLKSPQIISRIADLYTLADLSRGDFLTVTHGIFEVTIIASKDLEKNILKTMKGERVIKSIGSLSSLTVRIPTEAVDTVGVFYAVTKVLNWENINIVEIVSTFTEMTYILREDDVAQAFTTLKTLMRE